MSGASEDSKSPKRLSDYSPVSASAPPGLATAANTEMETNDAFSAQVVAQSRPSLGIIGATGESSTSNGKSVTKGSKKVMRKLMEKANMANPLSYMQSQKPPPTPAGAEAAKSRKSYWGRSPSPQQQQLIGDEAEDAVLASVEARAAVTETAILNIPTLGHALQPPALKRESSTTFAQRLQAMHLLEKQKSSKRLNWQQQGRHRRAKTLLTSLDDNNPSKTDSGSFGFPEKNHFWGFDKMNIQDESANDDTETSEDENTITDDEKENQVQTEALEQNGETLPLLSRDVSNYGKARVVSERQLKARKVLKRSQLNWIREMLNPKNILSSLAQYVMQSTFPIYMTLFFVAWILFYYCAFVCRM
ncbi:MAG: hypothetical protein SGILL_004638, partial [Bacillariaceae sp.]